jgi:hypothetical protein
MVTILEGVKLKLPLRLSIPLCTAREIGQGENAPAGRLTLFGITIGETYSPILSALLNEPRSFLIFSCNRVMA